MLRGPNGEIACMGIVCPECGLKSMTVIDLAKDPEHVFCVANGSPAFCSYTCPKCSTKFHVHLELREGHPEPKSYMHGMDAPHRLTGGFDG